MKILIISDTHLSRFDLNQYEYLENLISSCDRLIINGDFWDSWYISFNDFINSEWNRLFPLLLRKRAIYIYGNHDYKRECNSDVKKFCIEDCNSYDFEINNQKYHCEHGHRILKNMDSGFLINTYCKYISKMPRVVYKVLQLLEIIGYKLLPKLIFSSDIGRKRNIFMKDNCDKDVFNIFSDTHTPEIDIRNKFANTGSIRYGYASYIVIDKYPELKVEEY